MYTFLLGRFKSWQGLFYLKEGSCLSIFPPFSVHPGSELEQGRWWHLKAVSGGVPDACSPRGSPQIISLRVEALDSASYLSAPC